MSWYVEGRLYHSHQEYQDALAEAEQRKAALAAQELAAENRHLTETVARDRRTMDEVRNDVRQQMEISRRIQSNVQTLERNHRRLEDVALQTERRMQVGFAQLEKEIEQQGGKIHGVEVDVNQLKENHRKHVQEMQRSLSSVRGEMATGLAKAEEQRRETEERLRDAVRQVDQKVDNDRAARARQTTDQLTLAAAEIQAASVALETVRADAQFLDLSSNLQQIDARLASADTLIAQGNASSTLAVSTLARADAESLGNEAQFRRLELETALREFQQRISWVATAIGPGSSDDIKDCYAVECNRIHAIIAAAQDRMSTRYRNYRLLQIEKHEDQSVLEQLENEALDIVSSAPVVAQSAERRLGQLDEALAALEGVYGGTTRLEQNFARSGDPKSDLLVTAIFGSSKVQLRFALDGTMSLDGYGHGSAGECASAAHRVLQELQARATVRTESIDNHARSAPLAAQAIDGTKRNFGNGGS